MIPLKAIYIKRKSRVSPGGLGWFSYLPVSPEDMDSVLDQGRSHMPWSS